MGRKLWELVSLIDDATDAIEQASDCAYELSGASGGQEGDEEFGVPEIKPIEGWPDMAILIDRLDEILESLRSVIPPGVAYAIEAELEADDGQE